MTAPPDDTTADTHAIIAALRAERDAALATRDAALAKRNSEFGERIEYQAATLDVLRAMSASTGVRSDC
jgi:acyl dehydratase